MGKKTAFSLLTLLRYFLCFPVLWVCSAKVCMSQTPKDSIRSLISEKKSYTEKIGVFKQVGIPIGKIDFDDVIELSNEGLLLAEKENDGLSIGTIERNIGTALYFSGKYDKAAMHYYNSMQRLEKIKSGTELAETYNSTAKLFRKTRDLEKAANYYTKALDIFKILNDTSGMATIYNEFGVVFEYREDYQTAAEYYTKSLELNQRLKNPMGICYALGNLSGLYLLQKKYSIAERYAFQALNIRKVLNDSLSIALNYSDIGAIFKEAGKLSLAVSYFDSSNAIARRMDYSEMLSTNYKTLSEIEEELGNSTLALQYFHTHRRLADSLYNIQKAAQVEELSTKYETGKKENQILQQEILLKQKNYTLFSLVAAFAFVVLIIYFQYRKLALKKEKEKEIALQQSRLQATEAIIKAEESERERIAAELHDGVGQVLSAARMNLSAFEENLGTLDDKQRLQLENISALVHNGCVEVRNVSHQMMPLELQHHRLDEAVKSFISRLDSTKLHSVVFAEGFENSRSFPSQNIFYRIIQECVNNVIKHAEATRLDISLIWETDQLTATIEDDGKGFDMSSPAFKEGVGLKNMKTRIHYLHGTMEMSSKPGFGTSVVLFVPVSA